jgi:hypothetical protein
MLSKDFAYKEAAPEPYWAPLHFCALLEFAGQQRRNFAAAKFRGISELLALRYAWIGLHQTLPHLQSFKMQRSA